MAAGAPPPIRRSLVVPLSQADAFDLFVRRIADWWPLATLSVTREAVSCHIEPSVGGRVFERARDGTEALWGTVVAWDAPWRLSFTWHPGRAPGSAQEVEVQFVEVVAAQTRVEVVHRGWERLGERAADFRARHEGGWQAVLARFEALARGEAAPPAPGTAGGCIPR
ncbi:SRPBCC domain-containing protein [Sorangium sp. So ce131]|uniref:SRPBCC domain-containing protein n=1 Tax=Sorangium sp. So ce131 TaxID=3133282 RepID=UPI003F6163AC